MTCTDIVADALSVCQQRIPEATCVLVERDSKRIPCNDRSQRMLLAIEVHELVEQDWFSEEVDRVLEPGGVFVGVFQNTRSWRAIFRNLKPAARGSFKHNTVQRSCKSRLLLKLGFLTTNL